MVKPWETFAAIHKKGDKVSGQIKSITDFGIFIGLDGGIDGLIHLSDLKAPKGVEFVALAHGDDKAVANVHAPRVAPEAEEGAAE